MNARRMMLVAAAATLVAGCGADEEEAPGGRTPYEELSIASDTAEGFDADQPSGVTPVQGGATVDGPLTATGNLHGTQPTAPPGNVTVTEHGDQTRLLVSLQPGTTDAQFEASVIRGRCGERGQVVHEVAEDIQVDDTGIGAAEAVVPIPTERLLDGNHSIRLTLPDEQATAEVVLACADLPQTVGAQVQ